MALRRTLAADVLHDAVAAARALLARWARWPSAAEVHAHVAALRTLLIAELGWLPESSASPAAAPAAELFAALDALEREVPADVVLSADDFALLLRNACADIGTPPLGGDGGGVQVLSVVEARARTWEQLFVIGLNRDVFPRTVREDPLLPDALRRTLASVLPDIPIKQVGFDEERYLFAQLLSASPRVTLSWQSIDDEGKVQAASPLLERLRLARPDIHVQAAPSGFSRPSDAGTLRTAYEHAVLVGLYGARANLADIWQVALAEASSDPHALAKARVAVLAEQDPDRRSAPRLGPYFGFVGAPRAAADPRRGPLYVTTLERMAACPWQTFVRRLLAIEPPPDPLAALPAVDALLLGSTVHRVLERIVGDAVTAGASDLASAVTHPPVPVVWPDAPRLEQLLHASAAEVLRDAGIGLAGLASVLVKQARPYVEEARRTDWSTQAVPVLGAELEGLMTLRDDGGRERSVRFRADRVDAIDGRVRLTDYKTGRPVSQAKGAKTRQTHLLDQVASGQRLQAVAYALGARAADAADAEGRYLFLKPDLHEVVRNVIVDATDSAAAAAFDNVARAVLRAWDTGSFFPRLVEPRQDIEPRRCAYCDVAPACLRRDSGARARLRAWTGDLRTPRAGAAEHALLAVWNLGQDVDATLDEER
jgi:RecB family exonuclease